MRRDLQRAAEWLASNAWALVAVVALVVVVPILLLGESSGSDMQRRLRAERLALGAQAANRGADQIQTQLSLARQALQNLGTSDALGAAVQLHDQAASRLQTQPAFNIGTDIAAIDIVDTAGAVLLTINGSTGFVGGSVAPSVKSVADRDYFQLARSGRTTIQGVTTEPLQLDHPVVVAVPIVSAYSSTVVFGALIGELNGSDLAGHLRSQLGPFEDLYIVDATDGSLAERPSRQRRRSNSRAIRSCSSYCTGLRRPASFAIP
jgi:hypothetical protein